MRFSGAEFLFFKKCQLYFCIIYIFPSFILIVEILAMLFAAVKKQAIFTMMTYIARQYAACI